MSAASAKFFDEFAARQGAVCLRESVLDLLTIHLVPVVLGRGVRLLDGLEPGRINLELVEVVNAPGVTHLTYRVGYPR
jgi:hypothetical protein